MSYDYEIDDECPCPACGNPVTHSDQCNECDEMHEVVTCCDDICIGTGHCIHGDGMSACGECYGTGIRRWCPKCGANYWRAKRHANAPPQPATSEETDGVK